jgi:hypothetical protein
MEVIKGCGFDGTKWFLMVGSVRAGILVFECYRTAVLESCELDCKFEYDLKPYN